MGQSAQYPHWDVQNRSLRVYLHQDQSEQYRVSRLGLTRPDVPIFATFDDWRHEYFSKLDDAAKAKHVVEIALRPDVVYDQTVLYMRAGIKNVILPKPVTVNHDNHR